MAKVVKTLGINFPEGATPLSDYSDLKLSWVQALSDLNRAEAENIFHAQKKYLQKSVPSPEKWFYPSELKKIHQAMFCFVWSWAGEYRKTNTNIGIKPYLIPSHLAQFCSEVCSWSKESYGLSILERSARIHHRLVYIHPFENGNGRFSRLISDRYLKALKHPYPIWPSLEKDSSVRLAYLQSLKSADRGDFSLLINLTSQYATHSV